MKILNDYQKKRIAELNPSKPVFFRKDVTDCEHWGDVRETVKEVMDAVGIYGGEISDEYWDGNDCGVAYVECHVPFKNVRQVIETGFFDYDCWQ